MSVYDTMNELEKTRKQSFASTIAIVMAPFSIAVWFIYCRMNNSGFTSAPIIYTIVIIWGALAIYLSKRSKTKFKALYKSTFVTNILPNYFDNIVYDWQKGFSKQRIEDFCLIRKGNIYRSEDYLRGTYKGIDFEQADAYVAMKTYGEHSTTTVYFNGRVLAFSFPKNQILGLQVYSKRFQFPASNSNGLRLKKVELESESFNKNFVTKSANPHDAFYVLTPSLMERIQSLDHTYKTIIMYFSLGKLYLGIEGCPDCFDAPTNKKLSFPDEQARVKRDIQIILDVIDTMTQSPISQNEAPASQNMTPASQNTVPASQNTVSNLISGAPKFRLK